MEKAVADLVSRAIAQAQLARREKVVWTGRPDAVRLGVRQRGTSRIAIALLVVVFVGAAWAYLGLAGGPDSDGSTPGPSSVAVRAFVDGLPGSLIGGTAEETFAKLLLTMLGLGVFYVALLRPALSPWVARRDARRTVYVLTSRRAMWVRGRTVVSQQVKYFRKAEVRRATPDGVGDIVVTQIVGRARWSLAAVPDAARVREMFESVIPRQKG